MNNDYEIIVFSDDWNGLPFSCKHLFKYFLEEIPLIWVETIGLRSPSLNLYDIKRGIGKVRGWLTGTKEKKTKPQKNLTLLDPFQIPYSHYQLVRKFNTFSMTRYLNRQLGKRQERNRVVVTTWPFLADLIGKLNEKISIYYRVDDFSEFPGVNKEYILDLERKIINKVDFVVASAENLLEKENNSKIFKYLPHGVDYQHFANETTLHINNKMKNIPKPIIGFFGLFNSWLDFKLLNDTAIANPDKSFVFIGPSQLSNSELPSAPNIYYLGPVLYNDLPSYASYFDVGLIPFKINKLTISVNPLKLLEYFALGIPVISTPLPEVMKYTDLVYIANDQESFTEAICKSLKEENINLRKERMRIAENGSWSNRSKLLKKWIEDSLENKIGR